jgi:hypothetical protein
MVLLPRLSRVKMLHVQLGLIGVVGPDAQLPVKQAAKEDIDNALMVITAMSLESLHRNCELVLV